MSIEGNNSLIINPIRIPSIPYNSRRDYNLVTHSWGAWGDYTHSPVGLRSPDNYEYTEYEIRGLNGFLVPASYKKLFVVKVAQPHYHYNMHGNAEIKSPDNPPADVDWTMTRNMGYYSSMPANGGALNDSTFGSTSLALSLINPTPFTDYGYDNFGVASVEEVFFITPEVGIPFYIGTYNDNNLHDFWASSLAGAYASFTCNSYVRSFFGVYYVPD